MTIRRVVTGHDKDGKAVFVSDAQVAATATKMLPAAGFHELWSSDKAPSFPDNGEQAAAAKWFPPVGGFRFATFTVPPMSAIGPDFDSATNTQQLEALLPGIASQSRMEGDGMHASDTVDFEYVISGEIHLELDDGKDVCLKPGDTVVQNGTRHRWINKGTEPCHMVVVLLGAHGADAQQAG